MEALSGSSKAARQVLLKLVTSVDKINLFRQVCYRCLQVGYGWRILNLDTRLKVLALSLSIADFGQYLGIDRHAIWDYDWPKIC